MLMSDNSDGVTNASDAILFARECCSTSQSDWDSREISWGFRRHPLLNFERLSRSFLLYTESVLNEFNQIITNEEELNRIFIEIYGLQDELTPEVPLKDITILQEELDGDDLEALEDEFRAGGGQPIELPIKRDVVMQQFLSYCVGLMMGPGWMSRGCTLPTRSDGRGGGELHFQHMQLRLMTMPSYL